MWPCSRGHPGCVSGDNEKPLISLFPHCLPFFPTDPDSVPIRRTSLWEAERRIKQRHGGQDEGTESKGIVGKCMLYALTGTVG